MPEGRCPDFGAKMIRTLKITSILIAISAVGFVVFLVVFGLRGDRQIEEFLKAPSAIEKFKKLAKTTDQDQDQTSPLVKHAKAFALRINPPPPVKPKQPKAAPRKQVAKKAPPPKPKAPVRAKFKLVATCRYEQQPGRSLALLDRPPKGLKWYHQGDKVGHLTIQQVKDGSIVCSDGQELFVPPSKVKKKTLLKSELTGSGRPQPTVSTPPEPVKSVVGTVDLAAQETQPVTASGRPGRQSQPGDPSGAKPELDSAQRRRIRRLPPRRPRQLPARPTPEQRKEAIKEAINDGISTIKEMMANPTTSLTDEEKAAELQIWERMLKSLEEERDEIEKAAD